MNPRFSQAGFSLLELLIVMALVAIGYTIATFGFHKFGVKTNVESQTKQLAADLNSMRLRALTSKQRQEVVINQFSYSFNFYTDAGATGTPIPGQSTVQVASALLSALPNTPFAGTSIQIDPQGMLLGTNGTTVFVSDSANSGAVNCVNLSAAQVSLGKQNSSGGCDAQ